MTFELDNCQVEPLVGDSIPIWGGFDERFLILFVDFSSSSETKIFTSPITGKEFIRNIKESGEEPEIIEARKEIAGQIKVKHPERNNLKLLRLSKGLSQSDLAEKLGTKQPQISRIESGKEEPKLKTIEALKNALEVSDKEIFEALRAGLKK